MRAFVTSLLSIAFAAAALPDVGRSETDESVALPPLAMPIALGLVPEPIVLDEPIGDEEDCNIVIAARDNRPLLVLNTGGPQSTIRAIGYSPDSGRMYTGGLDKVVQVWGFQIEERGIRRTARNRAVNVQTLRWEIERGPNGQIYTIASSPTDRELAIGGFNVRVTDKSVGGDIVVYDTARGEVSRVLHEHTNPVVSIDYSPSGKRIVSSARNGEVIVWKSENQWQPEIINKPGRDVGVFVPVAFLDDDHVVFPVRGDANGEWRIAVADVRQPMNAPKVLDQPHSKAVAAIAVDRTNKRFATSDVTADGKGNVFVWTSFTEPKASKLRAGRLALSMDFDPSGRLFASTSLYTYKDGSRQAALEMWDVGQAAMVDQVQVAKLDNAYACKVSPDGSRVAVYSGDRGELRVYLLKNRAGELVDKPLQAAPLRLEGHGRAMRKVAFSKDGGYRVGYTTDDDENPTGEITRGFDLSSMMPMSEEAIKATPWRSNTDGAGTWRVGFSDFGSKVEIYNGQEKWCEIPLRSQVEGLATCFTLLTPAKGGHPFAIAIGTHAQNNVLVYAIKAKDEPCKLIRSFRDHSDAPTWLCASADGRYLASSSLDQSIKVWSLEKIESLETRFGPAPAWGASFLFENGQIVARDVLESGTAFRKGIRNGDVIAEARFTPTLMSKLELPIDKPVTEPRMILRGLEETSLTDLVLLTLERHGSRLNRQVLMIPAWSPVLSLFVDDRGEWAAFTPKGYYDASIAGGELFGWQMNRGQHQRPDFYRADQFRRQLERPRAMRQILAVGTIEEALRQTNDSDEDEPILDATRKTPRITIVSPTDAEEFPATTVPLVARVEYPDDQSANSVDSVAYVNGVPGKEVADRRNGSTRTFEWTAEVYDTYNRLRVVAQDNEKEALSFADVHFRLRAPVEERRPRLHLFMLAASKYQHVTPLEFPIKDAQSIIDVFREHSGALYDLGKVTTLFDDRMTKETVAEAIETWKSTLAEARPDDLLVVFLAGHGLAIDQQYYFVPTDVEGPQSVPETGISWTELRELSSVPCKKLFLLDTCHSGNTLPNKEELADDFKRAVRPLKQDEIMILTATAAGQEALEIASLGHGVFTQALLDGFSGGADFQKDQEVYLQELTKFVEEEVPRRTRDLQLQTPKAYPTDLLNSISVPLVTIR